ncbi:DUF4082 domain-containing protein [Cryobacterium arcticum]|uniref:Ig-like domain-containing protein n=1 Tax=Cryobacterium arcticum TaxID=670052 RepID=A0A317ZR22_9MICO|nr:DUF4082 domain-containing protein [Cryobacterium arcticum]PXA65709.1 hypothetical protein CTB96_19770 [Cryobacterium arcticum]
MPRAARSRPRALALLGAVAVTVLALVGGTLGGAPVPASAATGCNAAPNPVVCENALPGVAQSVWDVDGSGDPSIQGFSTDISANVGGTVGFKIDTDASAYTIAIYRTGWYQGLGARKIADVTPSAALPQNQPECLTDQATELYDCGTWALSASWPVPADAVSGVYVALLTRTDTGGQSHITFVVRNEASSSKVLFQTSDPTWQAYNTYGGSDFYQGAANGRAYKISYNRPVATRDGPGGRDFYFSNEYPLVRFLERNGYDVSYFSGVDTDRLGAKLLNHKVFLSVGHDEYWSAGQRANVETARDAGVNLQFLSGNEVYWKTRYETSPTGTAGAYRTLVSYKETWSNAKIDPSSQWTGTWRDPRFAAPSVGGGRPENALTGTMYQSNYSDLAVTVSAAEGKYRLWRNTSLSQLSAGTSAVLAAHTIGYESDEDVDNGFRPAGLIPLSTTTGAVPEYLQDFGNEVTPGTTTHHLTLYKASSGALVFSAGSVQWTWGLDQEHDGDGAPADARMQQAQVNLLADMGAQPATLMSGLTAATASTDTTGPTVSISTPTAGAAIANGSTATATGTATDSAGRVAAVEVSTDGGTSWHRANGTTSWTYSYLVTGVGTQSIRVRAVDDSANITGTPASRQIQSTGPFTVFGGQAPAAADAGDPTSVELGLRITPSQSGFVSGVRFYKAAANTGVHTGSLWTSSGTRLATVTFGSETASGWQSAAFSAAVPVTTGSTYVISYSTQVGHYSATQYYWSYRGITAAPLTVAGGFGATPAGVYNTNPGAFPQDDYRQGNYFVDAIFTDVDTSPLTASSQWPLPGSSSVPQNTTVSAVLSRDATPSSVAFAVTDQLGATVPGTVTYAAATRTATFTPTASLNGFVAYTVTLTATDTGGAALSGGGSWTFTTVRPPAADGLCPCSLFTDATTPGILQISDQRMATLGVRFTSSVAGTVSGVKFYKSAGNTGTHTGSLWSSTGTRLATATFADESTSGWQTVTFGTPVPITAGTEYLASYSSPTGTYSATLGDYTGAGISRGPLTAGNGAGAYTYADAFPGSDSAANYLVDVVFNRGAEPISVLSQSPANGAVEVDTTAPVAVTLSTAIASGFSLAVQSGGTSVPGATALSGDGRTVTFTPTQTLPAAAAIVATLSGVTSTGGAVLPTQTWGFRTAGPTGTTAFTLLGSETPAVAAASESSAVELGMGFTPAQNGSATAIRFFKGQGNTGTHTGSLWSATGTRLAEVTFTNETASGWQSADLDSPVSLTAGTTYVVSYLAPVGHYSYTSAYFAQPKTNGPLTAAANTNGRYRYGSGGGFPEYSWNATNYFVDLVFAPG